MDRDITLNEIKKYCEENGIEVRKNEYPTTVANVQTFGDVNAEAYFTYYVTHSTEIEAWRQAKKDIPVEKEEGISKQ